MSERAPLESLLDAERHGRFVGRGQQTQAFAGALAASSWPFQLFYVVGPGGIGKTSLLHELARLTRCSGRRWVGIDTRGVDQTPGGILAALAAGLGLERGADLLAVLAEVHDPWVLALDHLEMRGPLEPWLFRSLLPLLPSRCLVVAASRWSPSPASRAYAGWHALMLEARLENLTIAEMALYLDARLVPASLRDGLVSFSQGHPLSLAIACDAWRIGGARLDFGPEDIPPNTVVGLLEMVLDEAPTSERRGALEACAVARTANEDLLAEMVGQPDVHDLFEWVRRSSFVDADRRGLSLIEPIRSILVGELWWRQPARYAELVERARRHYLSRLRVASGPELDRILASYADLAHDSTPSPRMGAAPSAASLTIVAAVAGDAGAIEAMVARHDGHEAAVVVASWFAVSPEGFVVCRGAGPEVLGFAWILPLDGRTDGRRPSDPLLDAARRAVDERTPLRAGERANLVRAWMARDGHQAPSAVQRALLVQPARHHLAQPSLAVTFLALPEPSPWIPVLQAAGAEVVPFAPLGADGAASRLLRYDWRRLPPSTWIDAFACVPASLPGDPAAVSAGGVVLSRSTFADAVRGAMREFTNLEAVRDSPLARSRFVIDRAGDGAGAAERVAALRALLIEAASSLTSSPRRRKLHRALHRTYLDPAPTQELAAEALGLPMSTYRRHLRAAMAHVTELLWQLEIGGRASSPVPTSPPLREK